MAERFQPTSFQLGGSFVSNLEGFRQATGQIGAFFGQKRAKKAAAEGAAAVDPGAPELPERRGTFRASDRAFNQSSLKAYTAAINNDVIENTARIQDENIENPEAFQKAFDGYKLGLLSEVPDEVKPGIIQTLDGLGTKARINIGKNFRRKTEAENKILLNAEQDALKKEIGLSADELKKLIRDGDEEGAVALLRVIGGLTGQLTDLPEAEEILQNVNKAAFMENETADFINFVQSPGPQAKFQAAKELERLRLLTPPKGISLEEWDKQVDGVVQEASDLTEARKKARAVEQESFEAENTFKLSDLTTLNDQGLVSRDQLEQAFENGIIPNTQKLFQMDQAREKAFQNGQEERNVIRRLNGDTSVVLDPAAVNKFYDEKIAGSDDTEKALFVDLVKMVPKGIIQEVDSKLLSGDRGLAVDASQLIDDIDDIPGMKDPFTPQTRAFASQIVKLSANLAPEEAVDLARQLTDPRNRNITEARQAEFKDLQKGFNGKEFEVQNIVETGFFNTNVPPSELDKNNMETEFKDLVEAHFLAGMDIDEAEEKAGALVRRNWKEQTFMGKTSAFKYPLIDYYDVEGSIEYLEGQLTKDVSTMFFERPPTKDEIFLFSDPRTAKEAAFNIPTYAIVIQQDGLFKQTGQRFVPDREAGKLARDKRLLAQRKKSIEETAGLQTAAERQRAAGLSELSELGFEAQ